MAQKIYNAVANVNATETVRACMKLWDEGFQGIAVSMLRLGFLHMSTIQAVEVLDKSQCVSSNEFELRVGTP